MYGTKNLYSTVSESRGVSSFYQNTTLIVSTLVTPMFMRLYVHFNLSKPISVSGLLKLASYKCEQLQPLLPQLVSDTLTYSAYYCTGTDKMTAELHQLLPDLATFCCYTYIRVQKTTLLSFFSVASFNPRYKTMPRCKRTQS